MSDARRLRVGRAALVGAAFAFVSLAAACAAPASPEGVPARGSALPAVSAEAPKASASAALAPVAAPSSSAAAPVVDAGADAAPALDASAPQDAAAAAPPPPDPKNQVPPINEGADLEARARGLFDAIVKDDPALGEAFWFPMEPFIPLKDVKGPDKYWKELHRLFENDVHALHKKRKSWEGATFESYEPGSTPKWVKPGEEANKIGYYRSYHGKLRYRLNGERFTIDVHTIITWQGRWFITHLSKRKK